MIHPKLKETIFSIAEVDFESINIDETTDLVTDLNFDSLKLVNLIIELESQFNIMIEDDDLDINKISSVDYINKLIG